MTHPLIETARLKLSGITAEEVDDVPQIGELRPYTILTRCTGHGEDEMANEGVRRVVKLKIVRLLAGVDPKIIDAPENQPNLFDSVDEDEAEAEDDGESEDSEFADGPVFSAGAS